MLEYKSSENIQSILIFNGKGEVISKENPKDNRISLNNINDKELYISFIADNKMAFKSIVF